MSGRCRGTTPGCGRSPVADCSGRVSSLLPGHRARLAPGFVPDAITTGPVEWSSGEPATPADAVVWAIGRVRPNTGWLPPQAARRGRLRPGRPHARGARGARRLRDR
ncbi:hypothetical protein [Nocardioides convexus]|uniref:hypothetical protein n=1 Tax=Nocardioides convexus TaxID=2712224 RepID=UPI0024186C1F|nr:hypothetical protein [Nocardioides convexus]